LSLELGLPVSLREVGVKEEHLDKLAQDAVKQVKQ
jgi:alcohol dehydrogenase class IV